MATILIIVLLVVLLGGGGWGYRSYGGAGLGGVVGLVLTVFVIMWLVGILGGARI